MADEHEEFEPDDVGPDPSDVVLATNERNLLGSMLQLPNVAKQMAGKLTETHFEYGDHRAVFRAIVELVGEQKPVDHTTVLTTLLHQGDLGSTVAADTPSRLVQEAVAPENAAQYAQHLIERHARRRLEQLGRELGDQGRTSDDVLAVARDSVEELRAIEASSVDSDTPNLSDQIASTLDRIEQAQSAEGPIGVPTGLRDLDKILGGLQKGALYTIAARPGLGKSMAVSTIALNAATNGARTLFFSLEMTAQEVLHRMLANLARVPTERLKEQSGMSDSDWADLTKASARLNESPLTIPSFERELAQIAAVIAKEHDENGVDLVIIDYVQIISDRTRRFNNEVERISHAARTCKMLSVEFDVPVVVAAQINRGATGRPDRRPNLEDLKGAGSIEEESDVVIMLHRDDYYDASVENVGALEMAVEKHRNGPNGLVTAAWLPHIGTIANMAHTPAEPASGDAF